jgi:hypothetical protein
MLPSCLLTQDMNTLVVFKKIRTKLAVSLSCIGLELMLSLETEFPFEHSEQQF